MLPADEQGRKQNYRRFRPFGGSAQARAISRTSAAEGPKRLLTLATSSRFNRNAPRPQQDIDTSAENPKPKENWESKEA